MNKRLSDRPSLRLPVLVGCLAMAVWIKPNVAAQAEIVAPTVGQSGVGSGPAFAAPRNCRALMSFYNVAPAIEWACHWTVYQK